MISIRLVHGFILHEKSQYGTRHLNLRRGSVVIPLPDVREEFQVKSQRILFSLIGENEWFCVG